MKKILISSLMILFVCLNMMAKDNTMKKQQMYKGSHHYELGIGINAFGIIGSTGNAGKGFGPGAYFEYRYAFAEHFDVGAQLSWK